MTQPVGCHVCGGALSALHGYPVSGQVSSDCRPWRGDASLACCAACGMVQKPVTQQWQDDMLSLYADYAVYQQADGVEQVSFDQVAGTAVTRSTRIAQWLASHARLAEQGRLLDVGCGNGAFLRAFGESNPSWQMTGVELDARNRKAVEAIAGVTALHVGAIDDLSARFDLVAMIHTLEHIPDPAAFLRRLGQRLQPGGLLLIQVPDLLSSPFDLLIADHCSHFTTSSLRHVIELAGYEVLHLESGHVAKELSALVRRTPRVLVPAAAGAAQAQAAAVAHISWLHAVLAQASSVPAPLGIFGTSISATWLAAAVRTNVVCFVDEDPHRIGRVHMGLPVHSPQGAPQALPILVPLRADIAQAVSQRLAHTGLKFIIPPVA